MVVLLTRGVLLELHTLLSVWSAIKHGMPVLTVILARGGYAYDEGCVHPPKLVGGCMPSPNWKLMWYDALQQKPHPRLHDGIGRSSSIISKL